MSRRETPVEWGDPVARTPDLLAWAFWVGYTAVFALLLHIAMGGGLS